MELEGIQQAVWAMQKLGKYSTAKVKGEQSKTTLPDVTKDIVSSVSKLFEIPIDNVRRELEAFGKNYIKWSDSNELDYTMAKMFNNINNSDNRSMFVDILYKAVQAGNDDAAKRIYNDLLINGIAKSYIEQRMKYNRKKDLENSSEIEGMTKSKSEAEYK